MSMYAQAGFMLTRYLGFGKMVIEDTTRDTGAQSRNTIEENTQSSWQEPVQEPIKVEKVVKNFKTGAGLKKNPEVVQEVVKVSYKEPEVTSTKLEYTKMTLIKKPQQEKSPSSIDDEDQLFKRTMAY